MRFRQSIESIKKPQNDYSYQEYPSDHSKSMGNLVNQKHQRFASQPQEMKEEDVRETIAKLENKR